MIINLLTNAADAIGDAKGLIELTLDRLTLTGDRARRPAELPPGSYVRLTVRDSGCGMDKATLERVFDPFFTTKAPGRGTGLGLSVVHGIMKTHAGAISVDSDPGKGTTFCLYFPALEERQELPEAPSQQSISPGRGERILYLDDEEALILLTARVLGRLGYEVAGYSSPVSALEAFRVQPHHFDAVITDIAMPGMSGFEFAKNMLEIRADVPIVMVSGYLSTEDQERAAQIGIRELIVKPDTVDELARTLDRVLHEKSKHR